MSHIERVPPGKRTPRGTWRARYRDPDGRAHSRNFSTKQEAQRFLTSIDHSMLTGGYIDPAAGQATFREYAERWRSVQIHRPSTSAQVETNLRRHVYPTLGERPLAAIRPSEIQGWVRSLSESLRPATVALVYGYVATILKAAVADRAIASSPAIKIKLPTREPERVVPLETSLVVSLRLAVPERYRAIVAVAAGTGMRQGECFGLTVDRIDFLRRQVKVDRQLIMLPGSPPCFGPPKTKASNRIVPLPRLVIDALAEHLATFPAGPDGLVFTNEAGGPIRRTAFSALWRQAAANAGAPPGTGFHALRHYYASLLIRFGESVKTVQERLGHASAVETLTTYAHLWPDSEDRTRAAVDQVLGAAASESRQDAAAADH